jgi:hypothetical protein
MMFRITKVLENLDWLWKAVLVVTLAPFALYLAVISIDRTPPFKMISYTATAARAGDPVKIVAHVKRDLDRECDNERSTVMIDSTGARFDYIARVKTSAEAIRANDLASPDALRLNLMLLSGMSPGPAKIITTIEYRCNISHELFAPLVTQTVFDIEVLP